MPACASLPCSVRLHRPAEYAAALKGHRLARSGWLALHVPHVSCPDVRPSEPLAPAGDGCARLGLIVAKRLAKRAVTRNAIKRVLREAFRHVRHDLPPHDFVLRLIRPVAPCSLTVLKKQMRTEADDLFRQACRHLASQS